MSQPVAEAVRQNPSKRGLALIVTNGYSGASLVSPLKGPEKDGARMRDVFLKELKIATVWKHNVSTAGLDALLAEVATLRALPETYETISFIFAGHGRREERSGREDVYMQDGRTKPIQEIINALLPERAPNIGNIPKLFFIDVCRGSGTIQPVMVSRSGATPQGGRSITDRGATDVPTILVPPKGNTLVAYSVSSGHRAMEGEEGGIWMNALAAKLSESKESVETVLTEVREHLLQIYQDRQWKDYMQMPETVSKLLRPVYLNPKTSPRVKPATSLPPPALPGVLTQRDVGHPGHYRGRFLQLVQKEIIKNVEENYEGNFKCVLKFVKSSNGKVYRFQSEQEFKSQSDAKESAAKVAVITLDRMMQGAPGKTKDTSGGKASASGGVPSGGAAIATQKPGKPGIVTKDPKSMIKEYCEKEKIPQPVYEEVECYGQQYQRQLKIRGKTFVGSPGKTKKEAEKSAAQKALNRLNIQ